MESNFTFLKQDFSDIYEVCQRAEKNYESAFYDYTVFGCRKALEMLVKQVYKSEGFVINSNNQELNNLLKDADFIDLIDDKEVMKQLGIVRRVGNLGTHASNKKISKEEARASLKIIFSFSKTVNWWYGATVHDADFIEPQFVLMAPEEKQHVKRDIEKLEKEEINIESMHKYTRKRDKKPGFLIEKLSEDETRKLYIDILLKEAGRDANEKDVREYPVKLKRTGGNGYVDYVLWGDDGKPLAVVEAKKVIKDAEVGKIQAKEYADALEAFSGQRPLIFYTNGFDTYIWDDYEDYPPRKIYGFYKKSELQNLIERRSLRKPLTEQTDYSIAGRAYQIKAITKVLESFNAKKRKALLVMATGAEKTRVSVSIVKTLMENGWAKRVLFLADRVVLVNQARDSFNDFIGSARIEFETYPGMMNKLQRQDYNSEVKYGVGHFDLIIIDESHRSIYNKYKMIFEYFDAMLIGLTATPKDEIDRNTYGIFDLPNGEPTAIYDLEQAIDEGYLVGPKVLDMVLKYPEQGIKYSELSEKEKEEYEENFDDGEGNIVQEIEASAVNKWLFNEDTIKKILEELMKSSYKIEDGDKIGKTIIFAVNDEHAGFIVEKFNKYFSNYGGNFCQKITYKVGDGNPDRVQTLIDEFKDPDKMPQIAVSVDMLDTGIDIHEILNLVFIKKVRSKSKFWQMIGRGTRTCKDIYGKGKDKDSFLIIDTCGNYRFFDVNPEGFVDKKKSSLSENIFIQRVKLIHELQGIEFQKEERYRKYREELINIVYGDIMDLDTQNPINRREKMYIEKYRERAVFDNLGENTVNELIKHISYLNMASMAGLNESTKQFDKMMLVFQNSVMQNKRQPQIIERLNELGRELEKKGTIPEIVKNEENIKLLNNDNFLKNADILELEELKNNVRGLVNFLDKVNRDIVRVDFTDEIVSLVIREDNKSNYLNFLPRTQVYFRENEGKLSVKKIRNNIPLDKDDLVELENILYQGELFEDEEYRHKYREEYEKFKKDHKNWEFGNFLRSIIGLKTEAVQKSFSEVLKEYKFNGDQMDFIEKVIKFITTEGNMEIGIIFEKPFCDSHTDGFFGLFPNEKEQHAIFEIIDKINKNVVIS